MINRRNFLKLLGGGFLASAALGSYAFAVEPLYRLRVTRYAPLLPNWPVGLETRIAVLTDFHACKPWMDVPRIEEIVAQTNALKPDMILLLGDYLAGMRRISTPVPPDEWAAVLGKLQAPHGVHAVLGNHDWWNDPRGRLTRQQPTIAGEALKRAGINVMENDVLKVGLETGEFWLAGLGDQLSFVPSSKWERWAGVDDLPGTMAKITDDAPVILMAHEPDIFPRVPERVSLTLSGHTHGGQVNLLGYRPIVPSKFGSRFAYGHIVEEGRNLIVTSGLGCSILPVRLGAAPEIVLLELGTPVSA